MNKRYRRNDQRTDPRRVHAAVDSIREELLTTQSPTNSDNFTDPAAGSLPRNVAGETHSH